MKIIIRESQYKNLKRQKLIDKILDKISNQGIESLDQYELETLNNESNPNFEEKTFLINKIKYIVEKYGNIFLKGLTNNVLPVYKKNNQEIHFVNELADNFVNIIVHDGIRELVEYPIDYDDLDLTTLKKIDDVINEFEYGE
jgi:predicted transcriptional regulator